LNALSLQHWFFLSSLGYGKAAGEAAKKQAMAESYAQASSQGNLNFVGERLPSLISDQVNSALAGRPSLSSLDLEIDPGLVTPHANLKGTFNIMTSNPYLPTVLPPELFVSSGGHAVIYQSDGSYTVKVDIAYPGVVLTGKWQNQSPRWFTDSAHYALGSKDLENQKDQFFGLAFIPSKSCAFSADIRQQDAVTKNPKNIAQSLPHVVLSLTYGKNCANR
jgi:hypothetical protein